jgi:biopolymer transport protein ExbB
MKPSFFCGVFCFSIVSAHAAEPAQPLTLLELVQSGGWVMLPLILASVAVGTLIVYAFLTLKESSITTPELIRRSQAFLDDEDTAGLAAYVADRPEAIARVLNQTLKFAHRRPDADGEAIQAVAEAEGNRIAAQFNQRVLYIMDIGVLAPLLGLFGTVVGILKSFGSIATEATPMRTMLLAGGVSQALVATAAGLIVGITAMFFYSYFRGRVQQLVSLLEGQATALVQELILQKKRHP